MLSIGLMVRKCDSCIIEVCLVVVPPILAFRQQLTRIYAEPLLTCVSDNRKIMRDAAVAALQKVTSSGGESLFSFRCTLLKI